MRRSTYQFAVLLTATIVGAEARADDEPVCPDALEEARALLIQNEPDSAVERLAPVLGTANLPRTCRSDALLLLARAKEKLGVFDEAEANWRELLGEGPEGDREIEVLQGLARIERKLGNLAESQRVLEKLLERQPDSTSVALQLVETAQALGDELGAVRRLLEFREKGLSGIDLDTYHKLNLLDAAIDMLETVLKAGQISKFEHLELARLYQERGQLDKALEAAKQLETAKPVSAEVLALLGSLYLAQGELEKSVSYYERSVDLDVGGQSASFLEGLGDVFFEKGERDKAVRLWSRIVQPGRLRVVQKLELSRIYREHGLHEQALQLLLELRQDKTVQLPAHLYARQLADTYYILGQTDKALSELLSLVEQDPSQIDLMEIELQRMLSEDMDSCEPLSKLEPQRQSWAGHLFLAHGLEFCGKRQEATWHELQSHLLRNELDAIATLFAELVGAGHYEEATWLEAHLTGRLASSVHLLYYRARLSEKTGRPDQAAALYREYLAKTRRSSASTGDRGLHDDALFYLAGLLLGTFRKPTEARELLTDLILRFPASTLRPEAEAQLGLALYREGKVDEAIQHLDAIGPTNPLALDLLGQIQLARGELDKARVTLRAALAEYPDRMHSQPSLLALLQVLRLTDAGKEEAQLMARYRHALLVEDWPAADGALVPLSRFEGWKDWAHFEMASLAEKQGKRDEAIELYLPLTAKGVPDWLAVNAALRVDELNATSGKLDRAIAVLEKVILEHPKSPRLDELRRKLTERKAGAALRQQATP